MSIKFWVAMFVLCGGLAWSDDEGARFALVIGNAAYSGGASLANSVNDATDVAAALGTLGWRVTLVTDADRKTINRSVADFRDSLSSSPSASALFFYAGHGVQLGGTNYLIPLNGVFESPDDVVNDAVSLQTVLNALDEARVQTEILILDACRDNPFGKAGSRSLGGSRGLTVVNKSPAVEGSAVLFATAPGDTAADGTGRNGVFTQALLKYLTTDLSLQVLTAKVTGEVKKLTGGKQTPYSSLSLSDEFFLMPASMRSSGTVSTEPQVVIRVQPLATPAPPAGLSFKGEIFPWDPVDPDSFDRHTNTVDWDAEGNHTYVLVADSTEFDTDLVVTDSSGTVLKSRKSSEGHKTTLIVTCPTSDFLKVIIKSDGKFSSAYGKWTLSIRER